MAAIIDGKECAKLIRGEIATEISELKEKYNKVQLTTWPTIIYNTDTRTSSCTSR